MKKIVFTLMIAFALITTVKSVKAQTNTTPFPGGTYSYSLDGIVVNVEGTLTINYSGAAGMIQNVNLTETAPGSEVYVVPTGPQTLTFDIAYGLAASGTNTLTVTVTDGAVDGCSNFIELEIVVNTLPTFNVGILATEDQYCQTTAVSPLVDNTPASDGQTNTLTFTVTPVATDAGSPFTYAYTLSLPDAATTGLTNYTITKLSGNGSWTESTGVVTGGAADDSVDLTDVFNITFTTTTGVAPVDILGALSNASLNVTAGNATIPGTTSPASDAVKVKTMPSIGSFN